MCGVRHFYSYGNVAAQNDEAEISPGSSTYCTLSCWLWQREAGWGAFCITER